MTVSHKGLNILKTNGKSVDGNVTKFKMWTDSYLITNKHVFFLSKKCYLKDYPLFEAFSGEWKTHLGVGVKEPCMLFQNVSCNDNFWQSKDYCSLWEGTEERA